MVKIGNAQFRIMCEIWGVDQAIEAAKGMGMKPTQKQIATEREREAEQQKRVNDVLAGIMEGKRHE